MVCVYGVCLVWHIMCICVCVWCTRVWGVYMVCAWCGVCGVQGVCTWCVCVILWCAKQSGQPQDAVTTSLRVQEGRSCNCPSKAAHGASRDPQHSPELSTVTPLLPEMKTSMATLLFKGLQDEIPGNVLFVLLEMQIFSLEVDLFFRAEGIS